MAARRRDSNPRLPGAVAHYRLPSGPGYQLPAHLGDHAEPNVPEESDIMTQPVPPPVPPARHAASFEPPPTPPNPNTSSTEPLLTVGAIIAVVTALLDLVILFGVHLSDAQTSGVLAVVNVLAPLAVAAWGRHKVYAPATVARLIAAARR